MRKFGISLRRFIVRKHSESDLGKEVDIPFLSMTAVPPTVIIRFKQFIPAFLGRYWGSKKVAFCPANHIDVGTKEQARRHWGTGGQCPPNNLPNLFLEML